MHRYQHLGISVFTEKHVHYFINSIALAVHIAILIIGKVLRSKNMKMYGLLTYQVSLKRRYQVGFSEASKNV